MKFHKEGQVIIFNIGAALLFINFISLYFIPIKWIAILILISSLLFYGLVFYFFRIPNRNYVVDDNKILSPCDGKLVAIEEIKADEYFNDKRLQVSIFMSPLNVHINRNPVSGKVVYSQYHRGKYLVAWHPKSSTENERHSVVIESKGKEILIKQIAGAVAKRIINYLKVGEQVKQCDELGFIKFGSRVDLLLPTNTKICCQLGDKIVGGKTVIGEW